jgi:hypothetical protein
MAAASAVQRRSGEEVIGRRPFHGAEAIGQTPELGLLPQRNLGPIRSRTTHSSNGSAGQWRPGGVTG